MNDYPRKGKLSRDEDYRRLDRYPKLAGQADLRGCHRISTMPRAVCKLRQQTISFPSLPLEIRLHIYQYLFCQTFTRGWPKNKSKYGSGASILPASREIYLETQELLYRFGRFCFYIPKNPRTSFNLDIASLLTNVEINWINVNKEFSTSTQRQRLIMLLDRFSGTAVKRSRLVINADPAKWSRATDKELVTSLGNLIGFETIVLRFVSSTLTAKDGVEGQVPWRKMDGVLGMDALGMAARFADYLALFVFSMGWDLGPAEDGDLEAFNVVFARFYEFHPRGGEAGREWKVRWDRRAPEG